MGSIAWDVGSGPVWWRQLATNEPWLTRVRRTHDTHATGRGAERKALEEAIQEAADGLAEAGKVEAAVGAAEQHSKRLEWAAALERAEAALRYAHRAKAAMQIKVG